MKFIPDFGEFATKSKQAFKRFPITLSWAIIGTLFTLFVIEQESFNSYFYIKTILIFALGISWLIATRFFEEQFKKDKDWIFLITLGFLIFYYTILPDGKNVSNEQILRYLLYFLAGHLLVFVAPFLLKYDKNAYFNYLKSIFIAIVRSLFFSLILDFGIVLALLAIKHLFNVDFSESRYLQIYVICIGIVNTWIYLSDFPKEVHKQTQVNYTKALEVLVKYILIPLVILYLLILYAYSLKIAINWNLPKGWVSYLVIALSLLGFVIQLLINPIQKTIDSRTIRKFYPWFYLLLLPLIMLLFVAIFRRVSDYGITENRYFLIVLALWILGMTLYMLISKKKHTKWFPLSLAMLVLLISFGFWGAFSISTKSQVNRFEKVFNDIKSTNFTTTHEKNYQLESIIRYLGKKEETDKLSDVLGYNPEKKFGNKNNRDVSHILINSLDIKVKQDTQNIEKYYSYSSKDLNSGLNINGYDFIQNFYCSREYKNHHSEGIYKLYIEPKTNKITINKSEKFFETVDCSNLVEKLLQQKEEFNLDSEFMSVKKEKIKLIFRSLNLKSDDKNKTEKYIQSANIFLLVKEK